MSECVCAKGCVCCESDSEHILRLVKEGGGSPPQGERLVVPFADFERETFEKCDSLWGEAFLVRAGGYLILGGDGGVGKTVLLVNLAIRMAAGEAEFLRFKLPGRKVPVLFLEAEGSRLRFRDWVVKIARNLGHDPADLPIFFKTAAAVVDLGENLRRMVLESGAEFAVLDPIGDFFTGNENDTPEWRSGVTRPLKKLAAELGCAFAFCDHYSKPNENRQGRHRIRGAAAKIQDCGAAMRLEIGGGGKASRILFVDRVRDGELPDPDRIALTLDLKAGTVTVDEGQDLGDSGPTQDVRVASVAAIVGDIAPKNGGTATTGMIVIRLKNEFQVERSQAEQLIQSAREHGLIERPYRGRYRLPGGLA